MESVEDKKARMKKILDILEKEYGHPGTALHFSNPFQLLVATILSAQTTDENVNRVTPKLFEEYPTPREMARAREEDLYPILKSINYYKTKARNIIRVSRIIMEEHHGRVPDTMQELVELPGVARKTANIVLWHAYGKNEGIAVDTHVKRLAYRLGFTDSTNPVQIERDLMAVTPRDKWGIVTDLLITHGRRVCKAKNPDCDNCLISGLCPKKLD